jgi:hypothetical protein
MWMAFMLVGFISASTYGDFTWGNASSNLMLYGSGAGLAAGTNSSIGCFVQLIWAGATGGIDDAILSGNGVSGDDEVVATGWVGKGLISNPRPPGRISGGAFTNDNVGYYYMRFWTAPSDNYTAGTIPLNPSNFYGNTALWYNNKVEPPSTPPFFNNIPYGGLAATLQAVPEPAVFGLAVVGLISLRLFARKRK